MTVGAFLEPFVVVSLLFGGAYFNRNKEYSFWNNTTRRPASSPSTDRYQESLASGSAKKSDERGSSRSSADSEVVPSGLLSPRKLGGGNYDLHTLRRRKVQLFGRVRIVNTPNTLLFKDRLLSRVLRKFPFLVEAWYWALIYWVYQLGRAFTALTIVQGTVHVARRHALQVVHVEQRLHIFWEVPIQQWFLARPNLLHWINRVYSFIHIPGTIFFLVALYYLTTTRKRRFIAGRVSSDNVTAGAGLYEARRRTMAACNLIAFVVFTLWPCMPPRLLSDPDYNGADSPEAKSYGFVDSVHSSAGESSVWTTNKFCNQYAAMPSLHFGYSLLIGLTIATLPLTGIRPLSWKRVALILAGFAYPALILTAIVATANHFILDAVAGAVVCGVAWHANGVLLNLCVIEDYFLWLVRIHKPVNCTDPDTAVDVEFQRSGPMYEEV